MIEYHHMSWLQTVTAVHGTAVPHIFKRVLLIGVIAVAVAAFDWRTDLMPDVSHLAHSLVGIAMGMLIVFRTNTSYDRFWEGRKRWGGVVNASRNLVRHARAHTGPSGDLGALAGAYAHALMVHLRKEADFTGLVPFIGEQAASEVAAHPNPPALVALRMSERVEARLMDGRASGFQGQDMDRYIGELLDHQGACERILKTPVPFAYAAAVRQLLVVYLGTLPFVLVSEFTWGAVPASIFIAYALFAIEEMGVHIEDPFGYDPNDLPLEAISATIARDCEALAK